VLAFFNGHYDTWCYLPVVATVTFDKAAQFAVAAILRPGKAPASLGARGILRGLLRKLRAAFPTATSRVRLDGGFASPKMFLFPEREEGEYVVAMASNPRLEKRAQRFDGLGPRALARDRPNGASLRRDPVRRQEVDAQAASRDESRGRPASGPRPQEPPTCPIRHRPCTNSTASGATWRIDSRSCITGWRWIGPVARSSAPTSSLTLAAYILFQELRRRAAKTVCAHAQITTLRERLVKLAVWVGAPHRVALAVGLPLAVDVATARVRRSAPRPSPNGCFRPPLDPGGRVIGGASSTPGLGLAERREGSSRRIFAPTSSPRRRTGCSGVVWGLRAHVRVRL
jgi:Transposase DDE domain group 1